MNRVMSEVANFSSSMASLVPLRSSRLPYQGHKRANAGEDFTALAKELSEKPGADKSCGDLGFFPKDRMVSEFVEASFALTKKWKLS